MSVHVHRLHRANEADCRVLHRMTLREVWHDAVGVYGTRWWCACGRRAKSRDWLGRES